MHTSHIAQVGYCYIWWYTIVEVNYSHMP
jgi:hypothetical protein